MPEDNSTYPPIADYALISDCRAVALVSARLHRLVLYAAHRPRQLLRTAARLSAKGGYCSIAPARDREETTLFRRYVECTLVLETAFRRQRRGGPTLWLLRRRRRQRARAAVPPTPGDRGRERAHGSLRLRLSPRSTTER